MSAATLADLREVTPADLDELAAIAATAGNDELAADVAAERKRRAPAGFLEQRQAERQALRAEWVDFAHEQYLAAEAACCGNLVRRDSPVPDGWSLWSGTEAWARKNATEELLEFWAANPRITITQYAAQYADGQRIARDDTDREMSTDDSMAGDDAGDVRHASAGDSAGDVREAGPAGNTGHVRRPGLITIDDTDPEGSRVILRRDGIEIGRAQRIQVKVKGELWPAWWSMAGGAALSLHRDKRDAVAAIPR